MVHVCLFSGYEGPLNLEKKLFLTVFGGCSLHRPTVARQILARREMGRHGQALPWRPFFFTIFGGVSIKVPTMAEEFVDLKVLIQNQSMSLGEFDAGVASLGGYMSGASSSLTLFGGFSECDLQAESSEVEALAVQRHLGQISESTQRVLLLGIGKGDVDRRSVLRQAVLSEV